MNNPIFRRARLVRYLRSSEFALHICLLSFACAIGTTIRPVTLGYSSWRLVTLFLVCSSVELWLFKRAREREIRAARRGQAS